MPCLLAQHLLGLADQPGGGLVSDLILRDEVRFLGLDDSVAALGSGRSKSITLAIFS